MKQKDRSVTYLEKEEPLLDKVQLAVSEGRICLGLTCVFFFLTQGHHILLNNSRNACKYFYYPLPKRILRDGGQENEEPREYKILNECYIGVNGHD